jgi:hypothetical protein
LPEYRQEFEDEDDFMNYMFENGVLEIAGIDQEGNFLVKANLDRAKEVSPAFYNSLVEDQDKDLLELFDKGLIDIEYDENLNVSVRLSELGKAVMMVEDTDLEKDQ